MREEVFAFVQDEWGIEADYPFPQDEETAVLRHPATGKWFGILMRVNRRSLGLTGEGTMEILNLKCDPAMLPSLLRKPGYLPAYHMNKQHWLTLLLDGSVALGEVCFLLRLSHDMTRPALGRKKR